VPLVHFRHKRAARMALALLPPLFVLAAVWVPVLKFYHVPGIRVTSAMLDTARQVPPQPLLEDLGDLAVITEPQWPSQEALVTAANHALKGEITLPGFPPAQITVPFKASDLDRGLPTWQLTLAGLSVPRLLLDAYVATGRSEYLNVARDMIVAWADYERHAWLPKGFLWNDHAIAARVYVLADFWRLYRNDPSYDARVGKAILQLAARSAQLLAKPEQFTFATSHGIVQNLALWHICVVFPYLPDVPKYKRLALARLREQDAFLTNKEGVGLQHSAGYHESGLQWLSMSLRYLSLLDLPIPDDWVAKYARAKEFYADLVRPDGSLPMFGDTQPEADLGPLITAVAGNDSTTELEYDRTWRPSRPVSIYPAAGYAIWWNGLEYWPDASKLDQTVVAWSYTPYLGHKHADETSVLLWARGTTWWTNVGYWPYGTPGRPDAESWAGSNAVHLVGEATASERVTRLLRWASSPRCRFVELLRTGPDGYSARRQVLQLPPDLWIVVDNNTGAKQNRARTIWTTSPDVLLERNSTPNSYDLRVGGSRFALKAFLFGSDGTRIRELRGSLQPFAGWQVVNHTGRPTLALVLEQPADRSWAVAVWRLRDPGRPEAAPAESPFLRQWNGPERWELIMPQARRAVSIRREPDGIRVDSPGHILVAQSLSPGPDVEADRAEIRGAYERTASKYPRFHDYLRYRWKVTAAVVAVFLLLEACFFGLRRVVGRVPLQLRILSALAWVGLGAWLNVIFFKG
jgi:hypothetical protein